MRLLSLVAPESDPTEPLTLDEVKLHLRIESDDETEDSLLSALITTAREMYEEETGRQVVEATYDLTVDRFPAHSRPLKLPRPPLRSVTSVAYLDGTGEEQTWDASEYTVQAPAGTLPQHGSLYPAPDHYYPDTRATDGSVTVRFEAGYAAGSVPEVVRATLLLMIGDLYEHREGQMVGTTVLLNRTSERMLNRARLPVYA